MEGERRREVEAVVAAGYWQFSELPPSRKKLKPNTCIHHRPAVHHRCLHCLLLTSTISTCWGSYSKNGDQHHSAALPTITTSIICCSTDLQGRHLTKTIIYAIRACSHQHFQQEVVVRHRLGPVQLKEREIRKRGLHLGTDRVRAMATRRRDLK